MRLETLLQSAGALIDPALQLDVRRAELTYVLRRAVKPGQRLLELPPDCMPPYASYRWQLEDGRLAWERADQASSTSTANNSAEHGKNYGGEYSNSLESFHDELVDVSVELYNHLDKVEAFARSSPLVQLLPYDGLYDSLLGAAQESTEKYRAMGLQALKIDCFWENRLFNNINTGRPHLIPLLEFFNHHVFAKGFDWALYESDDAQNLRSLGLSYQAISEKKSRQVFASYEVMDSLHSYLKYAFIDDNVYFIRSQPFVIELCNGLQLEVGYQSVTANQCHVHEWQVEPRFQNSLMYRSRLKRLQGRYFVSFMLMPIAQQLPAFDDALLAQLRQIEMEEGLSANSIAHADQLEAIKSELLRVNLETYRNIKEQAENAGLPSDAPYTLGLGALLKQQHKILRDFKKAVV